jgi:hypothetical protein
VRVTGGQQQSRQHAEHGKWQLSGVQRAPSCAGVLALALLASSFPRHVCEPSRGTACAEDSYCLAKLQKAAPGSCRHIAVHPTLPYVLTCSDDMLIKLWDWDKGWQCTQVGAG